MTAAPEIRVIIDRLVLHGIPHADAARLERALTAELHARLAAQAGEGAASASLGSIRLNVGAVVDAAGLGRLAAAALAGAIAPAARSRG